MIDLVAQARELIRIVDRDSELPVFARQGARSLLPLATSQPELVLNRLEELRRRVVPDLPLWPPSCDYARCVAVETFWSHHLGPDRYDVFATPEDYLSHLQAEADPAAAARTDLKSGILVSAAHSWLVPAERIGGLSGVQIKSRLKLQHGPPYVAMMFPVARMMAAGVDVRAPRGVDAVPGRFTGWSPGDVPGERIDQDIPVTALGDLQWRP